MKKLIILTSLIFLGFANSFAQSTPEDPKPPVIYPDVPTFPINQQTYELRYNDPLHSAHEFTFTITANKKPIKVTLVNITPKPDSNPNNPGFDPSKPTSEYTADGYIEDRFSSKIVFSLKTDEKREITIDKLEPGKPYNYDLTVKLNTAGSSVKITFEYEPYNGNGLIEPVFAW